MKLINSKQWDEYQELKFNKAEVEKMHNNAKALIKGNDSDYSKRKMELEHQEKMMNESFELKEKQIVAAYEDKLAKELARQEQKHQKEMSKLRDELTEKNRNDLEKMMKDNYEKLSASMTKLHEEGNATTKHMQEMTKEVIRAAGGMIRPAMPQIGHDE